MKLRRFTLGFVIVPLVAGLAIAQNPDSGLAAGNRQPMVIVPMARTTEFPTRAWTGDPAEASFQGPFADALKNLLAAGFPDPAGLPYRKISIVVGDSLGNCEVRETEGWLLPLTADGIAYAIAWNGLVYPVVRSSGDADFEKTVETFMARGPAQAPAMPWEATDVMPDQATLCHGLYLTRFGKTEAATALLERMPNPSKSTTAILANDWLRNLHSRAVCAYLRGDARMALASLAELERVKPALSKPAPKASAATDTKGTAKANTKASTKAKAKGQAKATTKAKVVEAAEVDPPVALSGINFPNLKSECERMIRENKTGPFDARGFLATNPDVPALIDALDRLVWPGEYSMPPTMFADNPLVQALAAKGDEAVGPLLDCLANDPRPTRTIHYWLAPDSRDLRGRGMLGAHQAALAALGTMLVTDVGSMDTGTAKARGATARILRAEWEKYGKATGAERAYQILNDDLAKRTEWLHAAGSLASGEILRDKSSPTVSDLLEKRIADCGKKNARESDADAIRSRFLVYLLAWDPARGRAAIARQVDDWIARESWKTSVFALKYFVEATAADSPDALRLFEKMAWALGPGEDQDLNVGSSVTWMLVNHGASPELKHSRAGLFTDPQSAWCLAKMSRSDLETLLRSWREEGVTTQEPFRTALENLLVEQSECASILIDPKQPGSWRLKESGKPVTDHRFPKGLESIPAPGETIAVRRADVAASILGENSPAHPGAHPAMEYWWPQEARDARIAEVLKKLKES